MSRKLLDPCTWEIKDLFDQKIYRVPVYQRPYSWNSDNVVVLLDDIYETYTSIDKSEGYYVGNLLLHDKNNKINGKTTIYDVIDGQQRITTIALMLLAMYDIAAIRGGTNDNYFTTIKELLWKSVNARIPEKEYKAVELNSTEKQCFCDLFDYAFDHPGRIYEYASKVEPKSPSEYIVLNNFKIIHEKISKTQITSDNYDDILDYAKYIIENVRFIAIECNCNVSKVFSMFESINSKGKKLDDIDLIKTYIFSKLDETSYDEYLKKWGQLIIKSEDNLYDYFYTYIKAFVTFYRQNIKIANFKALSDWSLKSYFEKDNLCDTFKSVIDDMVDKVNYYEMIRHYDKAQKLIDSKKFRFFYKISSETYTHPKPLFLRLFVEYDEGKISKEDVIDIVEQIVKYMIKFTNIAQCDSKDVITLFSNIMNHIYETKEIEKDYIFAQIANETMIKGFDDEFISKSLESIDAFDKNKKISTALLALYESRDKNDTSKISYDNAYILVEKFSEAFSLDHLLVQTPKKDDPNYKYYCEKNHDNEVLRLKEGHDFPNNVTDGIPYETFKRVVLNKIANLRIYYQDKNSGRQNTSIELPKYGEFHTYNDILNREKEIVPVLVKEILKAPEADLNVLQAKKNKKNFPNMEKLIDAGYLNIGDYVYLVDQPLEQAKLIDIDKVEYKGEIMSINSWGCKVKGWSAIRIYYYVAKVGETTTLQEIREKMMAESNAKES